MSKALSLMPTGGCPSLSSFLLLPKGYKASNFKKRNARLGHTEVTCCHISEFPEGRGRPRCLSFLPFCQAGPSQHPTASFSGTPVCGFLRDKLDKQSLS